MNKYSRLAKKHGFDHEYEYRGYVKAKCKGKLGEFHMSRFGRSLVKANRHFESITKGIQQAYIGDLRKAFPNSFEYIDRDYIVHADLAQKPDVSVPPNGTHFHTGKSWIWLNMLIAEERAKARNESGE